MASDGVWDNIYSSQIKECIDAKLKICGELSDVKEVADCVTASAEFKSYDTKYVSPWATEARLMKANPAYYVGGKEDDITAIVSQVRSS